MAQNYEEKQELECPKSFIKYKNDCYYHSYEKGDLCLVKVNEATQNTLFADPLGKFSIEEYYRLFNGDRKV